jgi:acyl-CoA thioesterase
MGQSAKRFTTPFNSLLGISVKQTHRDGVTIECELTDQLRNAGGVMHGGVTATLVDAAVGIAIVHHFRGERTATTVEMKLNYFLPITAGKVRARAKLLRIGTSLAVGSVEVQDSRGRLAAFGTATYKLLD